MQRLLLGVLALALSACATLEPEPQPVPFTLPAEFVAPAIAGTATAEHWWKDFDDAHLDEFVATALEHNPALAQAVARARMAEAQARVNRADRLPQIGLGLESSRQRQPLMMGMPSLGDTIPGFDEDALPSRDAMLVNNHSVALDISWELDLWGRLAALSASARADYLASSEQLRAMRQSVAAQVVQIYFEIVHARAQVDLSERTAEALAEVARQINNRVEAGIASPADGMLADANLESARAGLEQRHEALMRALRQLEIMLGSYPTGALPTAHTLPELPAPPHSGLPAELLARRPDVRAAELGLHSAGYQLQAAQRSFLPSLSLTGSAGFAGSELSELFRDSNFVWSIAGRIMQPIFQGGRLTAQVDIAEGQRDEALHGYAETALNALAEVETALAVEARLQRREAALDASASAAEEAVRVSFNRYLQGIDPFLNVLESHQRALDGRSAYLSAHHARLENRVALHLALGGGFETTPLPTTVEPTDP